jgi:hypothetical protein
MPVDEARLVNMVFEPDAKRLGDIGGDPKSSVRLADAKYGSGLAVHLYVAALEPQDCWLGVAFLCAQPSSHAYRKGPGKKTTAR